MTVINEGDLKFYYADNYLVEADVDIKVDSYELVRDEGFETAVLISLFSDARAGATDILPNKTDTKRGFWGDTLVDYQLGSKLWLLSRSKITSDTLTLAEQYVNDSLAWMVSDGIADSISTSAVRGSRPNEINFATLVKKTDSNSIFFKWFLNWERQIFGGL